jgi:hypothetical protein
MYYEMVFMWNEEGVVIIGFCDFRFLRCVVGMFLLMWIMEMYILLCLLIQHWMEDNRSIKSPSSLPLHVWNSFFDAFARLW